MSDYALSLSFTSLTGVHDLLLEMSIMRHIHIHSQYSISLSSDSNMKMSTIMQLTNTLNYKELKCPLISFPFAFHASHHILHTEKKQVRTFCRDRILSRVNFDAYRGGQ